MVALNRAGEVTLTDNQNFLIMENNKKKLVQYSQVANLLKIHEPMFYKFLSEYRLVTKVAIKLANIINRSLSINEREMFMEDQKNQKKHVTFIMWLQEYDEYFCISLQRYYFNHISKIEKQNIKI